MSRMSLLVALAASTLIIGCSNSQDAPPSSSAATAPAVEPPNANAGKVVEVTGVVTVHGKPVAVGDMLAGDDLVETGADGHVVIELQHNLAHVELGPTKQQKVRESIAWKLPRGANSGLVIRDLSGAPEHAADPAAAKRSEIAKATQGALQELLQRFHAELAECAHGEDIALKIKVDEHGDAKVTGAPEPLAKCVDEIVAKVRFPPTSTVEFKLPKAR